MEVLTASERLVRICGLLFAEHLTGRHRIRRDIVFVSFFKQTEGARQSVGAAELFGRYDVGILPVAHPRHGDHFARRPVECHGRIVVFSPVQPLDGLRFGVADKPGPVEISHEILRRAAAEIAARIDIDNHHPLGDPVGRQREEVRTLELARLDAVTLAESAHVGPFLEVGRTVETHFLIGGNDHDPMVFIAEYLRVAEILQPVERLQDRVAFVFGESPAVVGAVGHMLDLAVAGAGVERNDGPIAISGGILLIYHDAPGENVPVGIPLQSNRLVLPMDQVLADGMAPVHVSPHGAVRIVLIIEMIDAILEEQPVRVVHPAVGRREMVRRAEDFRIGRVEVVRTLDFLPGDGIPGQSFDPVDRQPDIHPGFAFCRRFVPDLDFVGIFLDRKEQEGLVRVDQRAGFIFVGNPYVVLFTGSQESHDKDGCEEGSEIHVQSVFAKILFLSGILVSGCCIVLSKCSASA